LAPGECAVHPKHRLHGIEDILIHWRVGVEMGVLGGFPDASFASVIDDVWWQLGIRGNPDWTINGKVLFV
jgi:hypothetical protein